MHLILDNYDKFVELTNKQLRRRAHRSISQLEAAIGEFIDPHHSNPKPFVWTKTADQILASMARFANVPWTHAPLRIYIIVVLGGAIRVIARIRAGGLFRCLLDLHGNLVGDRFVQLVVDEIGQGTARR